MIDCSCLLASLCRPEATSGRSNSLTGVLLYYLTSHTPRGLCDLQTSTAARWCRPIMCCSFARSQSEAVEERRHGARTEIASLSSVGPGWWCDWILVNFIFQKLKDSVKLKLTARTWWVGIVPWHPARTSRWADSGREMMIHGGGVVTWCRTRAGSDHWPPPTGKQCLQWLVSRPRLFTFCS